MRRIKSDQEYAAIAVGSDNRVVIQVRFLADHFSPYRQCRKVKNTSQAITHPKKSEFKEYNAIDCMFSDMVRFA